MQSLFDIKHFEQFFKESSLKKGLTLFRHAGLKLLAVNHENDFEFKVADAKVYLKKKHEQVISLKCSKHKDSLCEHAAAVMFYMQREILDIVPHLPVVRRSTRNKATTNNWVDYYISETKQLELLYKSKSKWSLKFVESLATIIKRSHKNRSRKEKFCCLCLAALTVLSNTWPEIKEQEPKRSLIAMIMEHLRFFFINGLSDDLKHVWHITTLNVIKNNKVLNSEAFYFMLPRRLVFLNSWLQFRVLNETVNRRNYSPKNRGNQNKLELCHLMFKLHEAHLKGEHAEVPKTPEFYMAQIEYVLCGGKQANAFKLLQLSYHDMKNNGMLFNLPFIDFALEKAREYNNQKVFRFFLEEKIICAPYVLTTEMEHLPEYWAVGKKKQEAQLFLNRIKKESRYLTEDKILEWLIKHKNWDELEWQLRQMKNRFRQVHYLAMNKLPSNSERLFELYVRHLNESLNSLMYPTLQRPILDLCLTYLNQLNENDRGTILKMLELQPSVWRQITYLDEGLKSSLR